MAREPSKGTPGELRERGTPMRGAIPLHELAAIAKEVQELIAAGQEQIALERVRTLHPADMGLIIAGLPHASREAILRVMSPDTVVWMLRHMNPVEAGRVGTRLGVHALAFVLEQARPQQVLATLRRLPRHRAQALAETLEEPLAEAGLLAEAELLAHPPDTAGALMVAEYPTAVVSDHVAVARTSVKALGPDRLKYTHVFVVDPEGRLVGQIPMAELAIADGDAAVETISAPIVATVTVDTQAEECARLRRHYNLTQLPVIDENRLIGVILAESLLGAQVEEDTRQMLQVAAVAGETVGDPLSISVQTRLPWLTINVATTFLAAATIAVFESTLTQVVALAAFLPVVAGQGGIGGTQTLTLIVRAMALGELVGIRAQRLLIREVTLGLLHGVWLGVLVAAIAMVWKENLGLALVLGLAMLGIMIIAGAVGAAVPLLLRRVGVDPAVASAVIVTTFTDVLGFLLFLGIASIAISLIV